MLTLYSMVNETGNRNRILEMCKFRFFVSALDRAALDRTQLCLLYYTIDYEKTSCDSTVTVQLTYIKQALNNS